MRGRSRGLLLAAILVVLGVVLGLAWMAWPREVARVDAPEPDRRLAQPTITRFDDRQPAEPARTLAVEVVDRSGRAIPDARVCLVIAARDAAAQRCTSTDPQGIADGLQPPGDQRWRIGVSAPGYRPATIPRLGEAQPSGARIRVTLVEGGTRLRGRIEDATGGVIEGAFVSVEDETGASLAATRSEPSGEFELWGPTGHVMIRAIADGYAASEAQLILPSGPVVLRLLPESSISGRVLDAETDQPIADAIVIARRSDDDSRSRTDDARFTTRSDADGHYQLVGMPAGAYQLSSQGPAGYGASEGAVVLAFAERREHVDIRVHRGTALELEVVRIDQGDGCPGAQVRLVEEQINHAIATTTDELGRARLSLPIAGSYQVAVSCVGYRRAHQTISVSGRADERLPLRVEVERGLVVRGRVVSDGEQAPIAEAVVAVISIHANTPAATATADHEGRFELTGLDPGRYLALASAPGWFPLEHPVELDLPSDESITIPMRAGGSLSGRVIESDGAPVSDARVLIKRHVNNSGRFRGETLVDGEGRFAFDPLPPGEYDVDVLGASGQPLVDPEHDRAVRATVQITADQRTEIELVVTGQAGAITGRVVGSDDEPIASAFVCAEPTTPARGALAQPGCLAHTTDVDGSFELRGLQAGRYTVSARVRGGGEASVGDVEPGDDVELIVRGTGTLVGSAHYLRDGKPPDLLVVEAVRTDAEVRRRELFLRSGGRWSITGLPAGDYAIRIHASAASGAAAAQVEADRETNVGDVALDDRTSVSGRIVRLETDEPLPGFRVVATALDGQLRSRYVREHARNVSDASGRFLIIDPPTGRVTLHAIPENLDARPPDLTEAHLTVTINSGSPLEIGDVAIPTRRVLADQPRASFGFGLTRWDHVGDQAEQTARVETLEPGGPAARAGLELGDVITAIDGYDVIGRRYVLQYRLIAPVGTTITIDTERVPGLVIRGE